MPREYGKHASDVSLHDEVSPTQRAGKFDD
jgi:hypothetical protein